MAGSLKKKRSDFQIEFHVITLISSESLSRYDNYDDVDDVGISLHAKKA